jgi:hypothetical protein
MTKYFIGKDSEGIFAVYRATFNGTILASQQKWDIPTGKTWEKTDRVGQWYFVGNDRVWESTEDEVASYLPAGALSN